MNYTHQNVSNFIPNQNSNIQDQIQHLYEHQKTCEKAGQQLQAEQAKNQLNQLKQTLDIQHKHQVLENHSR